MAPGVSRTFLQKNRLNDRSEGFEARLIAAPFSIMWALRRRASSISDPCRDHLPFLIILRGPESATGVCRISASFRRQRMQKQPALHWLVGCNQPGHYLKVLARLLLTPFRISSCGWLESQAC